MKLSELLALSLKNDASDLHLAPNQLALLRVQGELVPIEEIGLLDADAVKNMVYSAMSNEQKNQFETTLELDFAISILESRFRVNVFRQVHGVAAVFRTVPSRVPTLDQLKLPAVFKQLLDLPNGLILVTGQTGSGKSTTLAAMIDHINTQHALHIITIEDPVEFIHSRKKSLISQRQVYRDTRKFNTALRSALRQDPDVIMLGEMRDLETIRLALTAAETGHLVMATLHTSSAPRTINRIIDVFPASEKNSIRNLLSESLQAVICQTLIKKDNGGRVPAFEIMIATNAIRNLIREDKIAQMYSAMQMGASTGMCTMAQYLYSLQS